MAFSFQPRISFRSRLRGEELTALPDHALINVIRLPQEARTTPWTLIFRRFIYAIILMILVAGIVWTDKDAYSEPLTFIDAVYYSAVSLSTTGYGDITPVTQTSRLVNIFIITPLRVAFLMLLLSLIHI